jgi:nicotinate phosphoribosyltransferase
MDVLDLRDGPREVFAVGQIASDPANPQRQKTVPKGCHLIDCRNVVMDQGEILQITPTLQEMADYCAGQLRCMPEGSLRLVNPHIYKVGISQRLLKLRNQLAQDSN